MRRYDQSDAAEMLKRNQVRCSNARSPSAPVSSNSPLVPMDMSTPDVLPVTMAS